MNIVPRCPKSVRRLLLFVIAILLPQSVAAQATLSVVPTSVNVQTNVGTNAPSQTVQVRKTGAGALRWTVESPAAAWVTVSPTSGTNNVALTLTFQTSALAVQTQPYTTSFRVVSGTQSVTVNVAVTIVASAPPPSPPTLTITCPANMTVASPNGSPVAVTYTVTTSGGNPPVNLTVTPTSGSTFSVGTTTVQANAQSQDGQTKSCSFTVTVTFSSPSSDWTFCAVEGAFCAFTGTKEVRYGANGSYVYRIFTGGTACSNSVFDDPLFGTKKECATKPTLVQLPPPPAGPVYGPQASITCPASAVSIWPGTLIQTIVNQYAAGTTFCIRSGVHYLSNSITPKSGDTFVGEYGAVLDGTGWVTDDESQAAFRAHNEDIDDVTIRNLVIRNMPQRGIHAFHWMSDRWTIEYNEVTNSNVGVAPPNSSIIRNNNIHHNTGGGYFVFQASNTVFESNEFAFNGAQKVVAAVNITFRNNFVHDNGEDGIFYDGDSSGGLIEGNIVEDNRREGIFYEISSQGIIRNNTLRRNAYSGIFISTSKNVEIYNNLLEDNFRGIQYFLNCDAVGGGSIGYDLANNTAHDNTVKVGTDADAYANAVTHLASCTATQVAPYLSGLKGLKFINNQYIVPSMTAKYFVWGFATFKSWSEWQALGNDLTGLYQSY
jgi:parallel beta-helix repeat protein